MSGRGYLVIADITGYTRFLTGSELDHAEGVLSDLFEVIVERLEAPLVLSKVEGDAFFAYADDAAVLAPGQVMDCLEALYFGFRDRLTSIVDNTTCACRACSNAGRLDLKFIVHHGEYVVQQVAGGEELAGPDVILAHRLLKNDVVERTGVASYALFTAAAAESLALDELREDGRAHAEDVDAFGRVDGVVVDFGDRWARHHAENEVVVADDALWMPPVERLLPFDLEAAWEAYFNPDTQTRWNTTTDGIARVKGDPKRIRVGAVDHCAHGKRTLVFRYVDVRPLRHATIDCAIPLNGVARWTVSFAPEAGGTRVAVRSARPVGPNWLATRLLRLSGVLGQRRRIRAQFTEELRLLEGYLAATHRPSAPRAATASLGPDRIGAAARRLSAGPAVDD
jgi:hypothetical protein